MDRLALKNLSLFEQMQFIINNELYDGKILKKYDECLAIKVHILQNNYTPFQVNDNAKYILVSESEALRCNSRVLGSKIEGNYNIVLLETPEIINKIERRQSPRIKIVKDIEYYFLPSKAEIKSISEISSTYYSKLKKSFTIDLSIGGVSLVTYESNLDSRNAIITLHLDEDINALCNVIRVEQNTNNCNYKTALQFKEIDNSKLRLINDFVNRKLRLKK
ncbi:PilZ domain-containing protein [Clostridium sp. P21]|uniref:PilZ domain-containing protein n=1 Tax=Clostridium muellerianum TaxID=2716538 RepID=A0A7Y0EDQ3_9CLOT|nr:PilZ domain-containing protein [Clostridium muellerianum]NMM61227.1 PilZ domain-containing protein [Clostridium muellerianum]